MGVDQLCPTDLLWLETANWDGFKVGNGLGDGPAGFLRLEIAQFDRLQACRGEHLVMADWLSLNNFTIIRSTNFLGFLVAPGCRFPILIVCCITEGLEPFLTHLLGVPVVPARAVLFDWCVAESCFVLERNVLELNFAALVEYLVTFLLLAVFVLRYECVVANFNIFMPALFPLFFLNMILSFVLCTANSSIRERFLIGTVVDVDRTTTMIFTVMRKP